MGDLLSRLQGLAVVERERGEESGRENDEKDKRMGRRDVPRKEVVCSAWQMLGMLGVVLGYLAYRRTFRHVDACNIVYLRKRSDKVLSCLLSTNQFHVPTSMQLRLYMTILLYSQSKCFDGSLYISTPTSIFIINLLLYIDLVS